MEPPVATLNPQAAVPSPSTMAAATVAASPRTTAAAPNLLPRLPPISSLLASIDRRHEPARPATREDVRRAITFSQPWATTQQPATSAVSTYVLTAPRSPQSTAAAAAGGPSSRRSSIPLSSHSQANTDTNKTDQRRLPPITTSNLHERPYASSMRSSPDDVHDHRSATAAEVSSSADSKQQRPRSTHLVSPTGGPLHPLPSGLVGSFSPSFSHRPLDFPSPGRPRSNSVSGATAAAPVYEAASVFHGGAYTATSNERRASASWADQSSSSVRKRSQDETDSAARIYNRPRMSLPGPDHYRHAYMAEQQDRYNIGGITRASFSTDAGSSVTSSPLTNQGPASRRGSTVESIGSPDSLQSLAAVAAAERNEMAAGGSSPQLSSSVRASAHLSPELAGLRISSSDAWRAGSQSSSQQQLHRSSASAASGHTWSGPSSATAQSFAATPSTADESMTDLTMESGRYVCPHCPKRFARPSSLRTHIHSHTGEKPFSCEHCGRGFSVHSNLRRHLKIHRGNKLAGQAIAEDATSGPVTGDSAAAVASKSLAATSDEEAALSETGSNNDSVKGEGVSPRDEEVA
ncbi:hypothetical protein ACM66B_005960 [Microbotryomycetes sp. NB124-2]